MRVSINGKIVDVDLSTTPKPGDVITLPNKRRVRVDLVEDSTAKDGVREVSLIVVPEA